MKDLLEKGAVLQRDKETYAYRRSCCLFAFRYKIKCQAICENGQSRFNRFCEIRNMA